MGKHTLQNFELHVLLAMLREAGEPYSVPLVLSLERRMERTVSAGGGVHLAPASRAQGVRALPDG